MTCDTTMAQSQYSLGNRIDCYTGNCYTSQKVPINNALPLKAAHVGT